MKYPDWYQKNAKLCAYIEELAAKDSFAILLTGKPGCGKTAIAEIVFDHIYAMYKNDSRFRMLRSAQTKCIAITWRQ